jgi:hypothetical protein
MKSLLRETLLVIAYVLFRLVYRTLALFKAICLLAIAKSVEWKLYCLKLVDDATASGTSSSTFAHPSGLQDWIASLKKRKVPKHLGVSFQRRVSADVSTDQLQKLAAHIADFVGWTASLGIEQLSIHDDQGSISRLSCPNKR